MSDEQERTCADDFNDLRDRGECFYVCPSNPGHFVYATPNRFLAEAWAKPLEGCGWQGWKVYSQAEVDAWKEAQKEART